MARILNANEIRAKASKGYISDYYAVGQGPQERPEDKYLLRPDKEYEDLKDLFSDHTFNYLVTKIVNSCLINGYKIVEKKDKSKRREDKEEELRKLGYDLIERSIFLNLLVYRNVYLEPEWNINKSKVKRLHILETTEMNINVDPHGEVLGYTQIHTTPGAIYKAQGEKPINTSVFFKTDECIHMAYNKLTSSPYGFVDTQSIQHVVYWKNKVEEYINELFKKKKFRDVWFIKESTSEDSVKGFIENIRASDSQPDKHIVAEGDIDHKILRDSSELKNYVDLIQKYEESISRFLLVPPLLGGDVGTSSRSTGEYEVRYDMGTTIKSLQKVVSNYLNWYLMPMIGMSKFVFVYNSFDKIDHEKTLNIAAQLKGLGYDKEAIHYYLVNNGIELPEGAMPKEQDILSGNPILNQKLQNMNAPSRKPKEDTMIGNQKVGSDSSTRDDQIIAKSKDNSWDKSKKYW